MSIIQPNANDTLGADNHALMHQVIAIDSAASPKSLTVNASNQVTAVNDIIAGNAIYFGANWRIIPSASNLSIQNLQGGVWVEISSFTP